MYNRQTKDNKNFIINRGVHKRLYVYATLYFFSIIYLFMTIHDCSKNNVCYLLFFILA